MRPKRRSGFTLIELMVVITIIGIILTFILRAGLNSIRNAEKSATISLIAKLESALTDRVDALTSMRAEPNWCHQRLAAIWPTATTPILSNSRAQVIAQYDYLRAELPDVFVVDLSDTQYPINFGALPFSPTGGALLNNAFDYRLPLGAGVDDPTTTAFDPPQTTGMKGASFSAAAAIYKQLGALPVGYNGADDGGVFELIDDLDENGPAVAAAMRAKLANHKHKTARSEMLYAILVEGTGPLGSVFNKDDFADGAEIKDTDGDGLMEFVDAFGEPLQFYRWPIMYRSDSQKGFPDLAKITQDTASSLPIGPYSSVFESREINPLDPNQQTLNPGWWQTAAISNVATNAAYPWGSPRNTFASLFHTTVDPLAVKAGAPSNVTYWDRSTSTGAGVFTGIYQRRAYYSHFLVLSGGPDKVPGTARLSLPGDVVDYRAMEERGSFPLSDGSFAGARDTTGAPVQATVLNVITIENQGGKIDPNRDANGGPPMGAGGRNDTNTLLEDFGNDDISNHNLHATGGPLPAPG